MPRIVHVYWSYPKTWESALSAIEAEGTGVYQIYRRFGQSETLLYIGLVKGKSRKFRVRMNEHRRDWLYQKRGAIQLRFGEIQTFRGLALDEQLIEEVEGALIYDAQPPENTQKRSDYKVRADLIVKNKGYRGQLQELIDTRDHDD
jgi:hypothetical protein